MFWHSIFRGILLGRREQLLFKAPIKNQLGYIQEWNPDSKVQTHPADVRVNVCLLVDARAAGRVVERHVAGGRGAGQAQGLLSGYVGLLPRRRAASETLHLHHVPVV